MEQSKTITEKIKIIKLVNGDDIVAVVENSKSQMDTTHQTIVLINLYR